MCSNSKTNVVPFPLTSVGSSASRFSFPGQGCTTISSSSSLYGSDTSFSWFQLVKGSEKKNKIIVSSHENFKGFIGHGVELGHLSSSQMSLDESSLLAHILEAML